MQLIRNNFTAFTLAIIIHLVFLAVMVLSLDWDTKPEKPKVNIVQATVINEELVLAEVEKIKKAEKRKLNKEKARKKKAERELRKIKQASKKEEKKRKAEQKRLADLKKQQAAQKKKSQALAKKRKEDEKKRKVEDKKVKQQQKVESERLKELEIRRKGEEQKLAVAEMRRKMEEELKKEKAATAKKIKADTARDKQAVTEIEKYISLIKQDVTNSWILPATFKPGSRCAVHVKLIPGGDVADVKVSKCTGDALFERSVDAAVRRASPLPVPKDPYVFDKMRDIEFIFNPN